MPYVLYNLALYTALLFGLPLWAVLLATRKKWRSGIWERLGRVPQRLHEPVRSSVWVHAVSVGEVLAAVPLVNRLDAAHDVYVSTTTKTGQDLARQRFSPERVFYFPVDFGWAVRAYMRRVRPSLVVMMETEFWPNFLRIAQEQARVAVVNARISDRSLPGYTRWGWLVRPVLRNVNAFFAQSSEDARRLVTIGADAALVEVAGNLKFDWSPPGSEPKIVARLRDAVARERLFPVIVAGSTVEGEDALIGQAFRVVAERNERGLCVVAPRHPERFDDAAAELERAGLRVVRRSVWQGESLAGKVLLLDSIGELASLYQLADMAVVGGSFVPRGGHNVLEPAYFGKAIVVGPHTENFRDVVSVFAERNALRVSDPKELGEVMAELTAGNAERDAMGLRARKVMQENTGATERVYLTLSRMLETDA